MIELLSDEDCNPFSGIAVIRSGVVVVLGVSEAKMFFGDWVAGRAVREQKRRSFA